MNVKFGILLFILEYLVIWLIGLEDKIVIIELLNYDVSIFDSKYYFDLFYV